MILIFSYIGDFSTDLVVDWLNYYQYPVFRLNSSDIFNNSLKMDIQNRTLFLNEHELLIDDIHAVWFRKLGLKKDFGLFKSKNAELSDSVNIHEEHIVLFKTICYLLKEKKWLTNPDNILNKCIVLLKAFDVGLDIPQTHITNSKKDLLNILDEEDNYITKSLFEPAFPKKRNALFTMFTKKITKKILTENDLPNLFSPSLLQKRIEKEYELRVFYINGKMYSMAIFSQNDKQTVEDFRDYNWIKPNRTVPYNLPHDLKSKIKKLMTSIKLNCGSLDFIKATDSKYYFLEINPVGQFGMIDFPCNYGLHQKVALELIKMDKS